jgi:hypothetical protein
VKQARTISRPGPAIRCILTVEKDNVENLQSLNPENKSVKKKSNTQIVTQIMPTMLVKSNDQDPQESNFFSPNLNPKQKGLDPDNISYLGAE